MNKPTLTLFFCALLGSCAVHKQAESEPQSEPSATSHFNVDGHLGYRRIQGGDWPGAHDQGVGGVSVDWIPKGFPIGVESSLFGSSKYHDNPGPDSWDSVSDVSAGLRKTFFLGPIRAYLGGGATWMWARRVFWSGGHSHLDDDDASVAWYGHLGAYYRLANKFNIGIDGRTTQDSDLKLFGSDADADHWQVTVFFGWGW